MSISKAGENVFGFKRKKTSPVTIPAAAESRAKKATLQTLKQVMFQVQTKPGSKVFLVGDFNNWDCFKKELLDKDGSGLYRGSIPLKPGTYEYKFHINGSWCVDPENPNFKPNPMGTLNSVIIVE